MSCGWVEGFEVDMEGMGGEKRRDLGGPFDDDETPLLEEFGEADGFDVFGRVGAVSVEVEDGERGGGVDVEECEGGGGDHAGIAAEGADDAAGELGFAGAEVAMESEDRGRREGAREVASDAFSVGDGMG